MKEAVTKISACRMCGSRKLDAVLSLGDQVLTGVFPRDPKTELACGPLELMRCPECGLVQLHHSFDAPQMYGVTYGYRSGLNKSMVEHLRAKVEHLQKLRPLQPGDYVLDIGSNDGTTLGFYPQGLNLAGFDPSAEKYRKYYRPGINLTVDFFSAATFQQHFGKHKARIVTSIAMFYDLENPLSFVEQVRDVLAPDGIWHLEQSYLPTMIQVNAYDTICHEHLEYYALRQIKWLMDKAGLKIIDVQLNNINGGSFAITVAHINGPHAEATELINKLLGQEKAMGLDTPQLYADFKRRVFEHRDQLMDCLHRLEASGSLVLGYGASTKGNVILQFCGITPKILPAVLEVNPDKFGCVTPGTKIPIISEEEGHRRNPEYLMVMPWHFKDNLLLREAAYRQRGGKMLFPLPELQIL